MALSSHFAHESKARGPDYVRGIQPVAGPGEYDRPAQPAPNMRKTNLPPAPGGVMSPITNPTQTR